MSSLILQNIVMMLQKWLIEKMLKQISNFLPDSKNEVVSEKISVSEIDYYYSNVIARASKTMSECRNNFLKLKKTGTDG